MPTTDFRIFTNVPRYGVDNSATPALDDLSDVTAATPADGEVLAWNAGGNTWEPTGSVATAPPTALTDLSDVASTSPTNGDVLTWNTGFNNWEPAAAAAATPPTFIADLSDVAATAPADGDTMSWNATTSTWEPVTAVAAPTVIADLSDVAATAPADGDTMSWNATTSTWEPVTAVAAPTVIADLSDVAATAPADGDSMSWNATTSTWEPVTAAGATVAVVYKHPTAVDDMLPSTAEISAALVAQTATATYFGANATDGTWRVVNYRNSVNDTSNDRFYALIYQVFTTNEGWLNLSVYSLGNNPQHSLTQEWRPLPVGIALTMLSMEVDLTNTRVIGSFDAGNVAVLVLKMRLLKDSTWTDNELKYVTINPTLLNNLGFTTSGDKALVILQEFGISSNSNQFVNMHDTDNTRSAGGYDVFQFHVGSPDPRPLILGNFMDFELVIRNDAFTTTWRDNFLLPSIGNSYSSVVQIHQFDPVGTGVVINDITSTTITQFTV
jgi:hypothetical protein